MRQSSRASFESELVWKCLVDTDHVSVVCCRRSYEEIKPVDKSPEDYQKLDGDRGRGQQTIIITIV